MLPALRGQDPKRQVVYSEVQSKWFGYWQMVLHKQHKYVLTEDTTEFLFDLSSDPHELEDLAARARSQEEARDQRRASTKLLKAMRKLHRKWLARTPSSS